MPIPYFSTDLTTQPTPLDLLVFLGSLILFGFACFTAGRTIRQDRMRALRAQRDAAWNEAEQMRRELARTDKVKAEIAALLDERSAEVRQAKAEIERLKNLLAKERKITNCADMDALKAEVERLRDDVAQRIYERDHYIDQCNRWIAERDALKAEVERLRAEVKDWRKADVELRKLGVEVYQDTERGDGAIAIVIPALAEVKRLRAEAEYRASEFTKVIKSTAAMRDSLTAERDAAIARADGMERAGAEQAKRADQNQADMLEWRARAEKAERNEAVCYCGSRISDHDPMNDGHGPVEMHEPCPFEQQRDTARAAHAEAMELLERARPLVCRYSVGPLFADLNTHLAKYGKDASK